MAKLYILRCRKTCEEVHDEAPLISCWKEEDFPKFIFENTTKGWEKKFDEVEKAIVI